MINIFKITFQLTVNFPKTWTVFPQDVEHDWNSNSEFAVSSSTMEQKYALNRQKQKWKILLLNWVSLNNKCLMFFTR